MTLTEMAEALGLKDAAGLRRLCEAGQLRGAEKKGKTWLVPRETVDAYKRDRLGKRGRPPSTSRADSSADTDAPMPRRGRDERKRVE